MLHDTVYPRQQRDFHKSCLQESGNRGWKTACDPTPAKAKQTEAKRSKSFSSDRWPATKQSTCKLAKCYIPAVAHPSLILFPTTAAAKLTCPVNKFHFPLKHQPTVICCTRGTGKGKPLLTTAGHGFSCANFLSALVRGLCSLLPWQSFKTRTFPLFICQLLFGELHIKCYY